MLCKAVTCFLVVLLIASCTKEKVKNVHPEFIGHWLNHPKAGYNVHLYIYDSGKGYVGHDGEETYFEESRTLNCYFAKGKLFFGRHFKGAKPDQHFIYKVTTYPEPSVSGFISNLDTVNAYGVYMKLEGDVFVKQ